ncbi:hypothetical protein PHABIO_34 [Pseudomonas phage Phabio]|uniref:Uncharacterized protein n=1 Tax=Pseudomonas phage Phabio TaxID=2006668 RepID=A0A1Y0SW10_9CAUD|nr:hypothetical protein MZD05_gp034 [Pseudomonas phage Phabio]ARV76665.1 hypothetical protein PHABIO_34 [Pseudomonas phage Phabio]
MASFVLQSCTEYASTLLLVIGKIKSNDGSRVWVQNSAGGLTFIHSNGLRKCVVRVLGTGTVSVDFHIFGVSATTHMSATYNVSDTAKRIVAFFSKP